MAGKRLWGGRFRKGQSEELFSFCSGQDVLLDAKLLLYDIEGSMAHVCMLAKQGIIAKAEARHILKALLLLHARALGGKFSIQPDCEDAHSAVEAEVTKITPAGKKMHTARSRNDQICLDTRLYMRDAINELSAGLIALQKALADLAATKDCPLPSYTHTQVAQPASVAFWAHAHWQEIERDLERLSQLYQRANENPLGAGAVAGTGWQIDRQYTSRLLGFSKATENPMDTVSARGELEAELLSCLVLAMNHCAKMAEDVILLSSKRLVILPDEYSTGSSMMPQKKNPDPLELVRAKAGRVLGLYVMACAVMKGLPSGYNKDTQETKFALIDGVETALASFSILSKMLPLLEFDRKRVLQELEEGFACATELADLLAKKGMPFREAHEATGRIVRECIANGKFLSQLSAEEVFRISKVMVTQKELQAALSADKAARFSSIYKIPKASKHGAILQKRRKALASAHALLLSEVRRITG
ncbi:MAG: argininosuccinate lyase [Candidatus Micrarchaeota archaeon]|nr:argininosuccinate lyase [Candidatus Micrarchaeota archaeon]